MADARRQDRRPVGRLVLRVVVQGVLLAAGLAVVGLGFARFVDAHDVVVAHRSAPVCGSADIPPGADCAQRESGRVTDKKEQHDSDSDSYILTVAREKASPETYSVGEAFYDDVSVDTVVDLKVWRGRAIEVSYHGHRAEVPSTPWMSSLWVGLLIGLGTALTAAGLLGPRLPDVANLVGVILFVGIITFMGASIQLMGRFSLPLALALSITAWLITVAISTSIAME
ncbi:hypothetical protein [Kitasatospora sp. NPDC097643]|uniref:hypothetical protein n=1 Tax=Kitasatospora sp. NPDC097643 TaxID=3157230 RepID=UPI0033337F7A